MIYCEKYKIKVNPEEESMCPSCEFLEKRKTPYGAIYYRCIYGDTETNTKNEEIGNA